MSTKNAITLLQEYCQKRGQALPQYIEISSTSGVHPNKFICRCSCIDNHVDGEGPSKQSAKLNSAEKMIRIIAVIDKENLKKKVDVPIPSVFITPKDLGIPVELLDEKKNKPNFINYIGDLQELCVSNSIKVPVYKEQQSDTGFTFTCTIEPHIATGSAGNKRDAKQASARKMIELLNKQYPKLFNNSSNLQAIEDAIQNDNEIIESMSKLDFKKEDIQVSNYDQDKRQNEDVKKLYFKLANNNFLKLKDPSHDTINSIKSFHMLFKESYEKNVLDKFYSYCKNNNIVDSTPDKVSNIFNDFCDILKLKTEIKYLKTKNDIYVTHYSLLCYPKSLDEIGLGATRESSVLNCLTRLIHTIYILLH